MILCDMDGVLARGPIRDTAPGHPIYRTFVERPVELERIRTAEIPIHLVTAKEEAEASQVLRAVGVAEYFHSIVSANQMFWPTVRSALMKGRLPGTIAKSTARRLVPSPRSGVVAMVEDRREHLQAMLEDRAVTFGILVPPIVVSDGRVTNWFDLDLTLRVARGLVQGTLGAADLADLGARVARFRTGSLEAVDLELEAGPLVGHGYLVEVPPLGSSDASHDAPSLESLDTGHTLRAGPRTTVSMVREGLRILRRRPARGSTD